MKDKRSDAIVGFVILISLVILIVGVLWLKGASMEKRQTLVVSFRDVGNLTAGNPVVVNGVRSGKVSEIRQDPTGPRVLVTLKINANLMIPEDSRIVIENVGIMGEQRVGILLGQSVKPLNPGRIWAGTRDAGIAEAMGMLGTVFQQVDTIVQDLQVIIRQTVGADNFAATFNTILVRIDKLSLNLERLVQKNELALNQSIENLRVTSRDARTLLEASQEPIGNIVKNFSAASDRTGDLLSKLDVVVASLESIMVKVNQGQGTLGRLVQDDRLYQDMKALAGEADTLIRRLNRGEKINVNVDLW